MAAACATSCFVARHERGSSDRKMPPWKIGLDDCEWGGGVEAGCMPWAATRRCDGCCMERAPRREVPTRILARFCWPIRLDSARSKHYTESGKVLDVSHSTPPPYGNSPPSYWDAVVDAPPDYTTTDHLANAHTDERPASPPYRDSRRREQKVASLLEDPMSPRAVDLGDTSGFVTHGAAKKKKQAAKQANQAKWANSDDEGGSKEGGEANDNAGGAGGSNNGDGGAGGGDDGDDWWDTGKKKKGKKGKGGVDEDEKKKKKEEEEEEKKRKEEEEKAKQEEEDIGNGNNPLSWADSVGDANANPDDEWGGFTATAKKGKKGKKGKAADSVPGPPPPPPAPSAPAGSTDPPSVGTFDDINLDDGVPKLDLDFGGSTTTKEAGSNFGFGGWGNSWNTGSKWDFSSADAGTTAPPKDAKESKGDLADNNPWSFGKKKDKKSTFSSGFDFGDLGSVGETHEEEPKGNGVAKEEDDFGGFTSSIGKKDKKKGKKAVPEALPEEEPPAAVVVPEAETANGDSWGGWGTASSKKDKKKGKKGVIEEVPVEEPAVVVVPEPETAADDSWGGWGSKKDKKKGKKEEQEPLPPPPPPPPPDPVAVVEEEWGTFGTKNKKKGKKGAVEQVSKVEEPIIAILPEPDAEADEYPEYEPEPASAAVPDTWGSFGNKKDKKKGKKGAVEENTKVEDPVAIVVPEVIPEPTTTAADDTWGSFTKKDKKKGKKGVVEEITKVEEPIVTVPEPETAAPAADDLWTSFGSKKDKKKGKKGAVEEISKVEDPPIVAVPDPAPIIIGDEWGTFGAKKDKKKGKNGAFEEPFKVEDPGVIDVPEQESAADIGWGGWGGTTKNDKKSKKKGVTEVADVPITGNEPVAAVEEVSAVADDDWMNWGTGKKKDKKGKKGGLAEPKADESLPPPPPPPPVVPSALEDSKTEDWGSFGPSKQNKDKKGKKGKVSEPAPIVPVPEPLVAVVDAPDVTGVEDSWGTWGLSSKDKKKKEKEKAKWLGQDTSIEVVEDPTTMSGTFPDAIVDLDAPAETDTWGIWGTGSKKDKKKAGKRDHVLEAPPPAPTPPAQGLTPEPTSPPFPALDDPEEGEWGAFAPVKTKGKKDVKKDPLPRTTSTSKGAKIEDTTSNKKGAKEPVDDYFNDLDGDDEDKYAAEVKKESPKEETPAKAVKGFWGSFGSTATSKPKTAKEKEKEKAKEKEEEKSKVQAQEEIKSDPNLEVVDRTDKKGSRNKKDNKLGKVESKGSDKSGKVDDPKGDDIDALIDLMDGDPELNEDEMAELADSLDKKDDKKADAWSFWGSSKKPTGKKADEPKKEIGKQASTNQKAALGKPPNEPEAPIADQPLPPPPPPSTTAAMNKSISAKSKVAGKLSVSEKIKALEKEKEKKTEPIPPPPPPEPEASPKADTPPKKSNSLAKAKSVTATKGAAASKKKDLSPDPAKDKASQESVPGSFPSEGADDDIIDVIDLGPVDKKVTKKAKKGAEKIKMDPMIVDVPAPPSPPTPPAPPTPPPEPTAAKPVKKERARVVRGEGASSWGFWGAAPRKEVKKEKAVKDDVDGGSPPAPVKAKASPPAMVRSKSTKTAKETEKSSSKSSGSDKVTKQEAKPSKSRGMSFSQLLMGGPSPARTKSTRRSSNAVPKTTSRRQSVDVGVVGLMSPPPDDQPEVSAKAAKLMGMGSGKMDRRPSSKGKQKAPGVVPDPYAIDDDDDLIMVNGDDDALVDDVLVKASSSKKKGPETRAKKLPKQFGGATAATDDIVMLEAGPSNDGPEVTTGSDDLAFVLPPRKPAPLKRSISSAKKPEKLMGLFGSFRKSRRASETFERPKSKAVYGDDDTKRLRREDRKVRRSGKDENDAEIFNADVLPGGGASTEPEDQGPRKDDRRSTRVSRDSPTKRTREAEARAAEERRARRRDAEKAEEEMRRAKAREAREKRVREEEEDEARRREEKKMRRAAREAPDGETGLRNGEHRRRHRDKGFSSGAPSPMVDERSPRPRKTDRRRSHTDKPVPRYGADEETDRRVRREARRAREDLNRRKSAPPVEDYFDPRNGSRGIRPNDFRPDVPVYSAPAPLPTHADPYLNGANDHTSSWVNSQIIEPPAPPPVEPTVIEPPPTGSGRKHEELDDRKDVRRETRRAHRHSKYTSVTPDGVDDRHRRRDSRRTERDGIRSSEGSEGDRYTRRKSDYAGYENGGPVRTFDGRLAGAGAGKRGSWFKKIANL